MKTFLIVIAVIVATTDVAHSQSGFLTAYSDVGGTNCEFNGVTNGGLMQMYLFHDLTPGATASRFKLELGIAYTSFGFISPFALVTGDPLSGVAISYGSCWRGPIYLGVVNGLAASQPAPCTPVSIVPDPTAASGGIEVVDCGSNLLCGNGTTHYINPTPACEACGPARDDLLELDCQPIPVAEATWGKVKSLYQ